MVACAASATVAATLISCDASEDDALLNPPPPDSTLVRVINLVDGSAISASLGPVRIATDLSPMSVSGLLPAFSAEPMIFTSTRASSGRTDSITGQVLARGARITYLTMRRGDTGTTTLTLSLGRQDLSDILARQASIVTLVNAVDDTTFLGIRMGCQSGDTVADGVGYARSTSVESTSTDRSLFVVQPGDSIPLGTVRLTTPPGTVTYLIATRERGAFKLFVVEGDGAPPGRLGDAPPETRTTAKVSLLNANFDGASVSASLESGSTIAVSVPVLTVSAKTDVAACVTARGDRLIVVSSTGDTTAASLRLTVGADALVAVYDRISEIKAVILDRKFPGAKPGHAFVRCANLSTSCGTASVAIGSGSPDTVLVEGRPFGTLEVGAQSPYVPLRTGTYPFMLDRSTDGVFLDGGVESLNEGYYTIVIVDRAGAPRLMVIRDDAPAPTIANLNISGVRVSLFNTIAGRSVTFVAGGLRIPPIPYSYVSRTIVGTASPTIESNIGSVAIDARDGPHTVVAANADGSDRLFAFPVNRSDPPAKSAWIRAFSSVSEQLEIREDDPDGNPLDVIQSGSISDSKARPERRYSFFVTRADGTVVGESPGVALVGGRRYLMVIVQADSMSTKGLPYSIVWMQE